MKRAFFITTTGVFSRFHRCSDIYKAGERMIADSGLVYTILRPSMIYGNDRDRNVNRLIRFLRGCQHPFGRTGLVPEDRTPITVRFVAREQDRPSLVARAHYLEQKAKGYSGQDATVRLFVQTLRKPKSAPQAITPPEPPETEPDRCSPGLIADLVLKRQEARSAREQKLLVQVDRVCEPFGVFRTLAQRFLDLLRAPKDKGSSIGFAVWMAEASGSGVAEVRRFAKGLEQDRLAVEVAMALPWSNGPVEGSVVRLKAIKRQMNGRANFDLLRKRVLAPG